MLEKWGQQLNPNISKAADIAGSDSIEEAESNEAVIKFSFLNTRTGIIHMVIICRLKPR
jgi:hypothetical protein